MSEKLNGLENYITETYASIQERIGDLEHKTEYLDESIKVTRDDLMKYADEKIKSVLTEHVDDVIKKRADKLLNVVTENGKNAVKLANNADEYIESERKLVADISSNYTGTRNKLKFTVKADKMLVQPNDYLKDKFKPISNELYKHGYKLDKDKEHGWYWWKIIPLEVA